MLSITWTIGEFKFTIVYVYREMALSEPQAKQGLFKGK